VFLFTSSRPNSANVCNFVETFRYLLVSRYVPFDIIFFACDNLGMPSVITRKRTTKTRVADMTTDELQDMLESVIDRKMSEWASDPRVARRRAEIAANAAATRNEHQAGKVRRGNVKDLMADLNA
jgi:hypothetical protein